MKIFSVVAGKIQEIPSLCKALRLDHAVKTVVFVGGGGKTTLLQALAQELRQSGKRVVVTTTTHISKPAGCFVADGDMETARKMLAEKNIVVAGRDCGDGKLAAVDAAFFAALQRECDYLLVEADGARGLPLKVPAAHEPVLPQAVDLVVGVAGIDALGKAIGTACHRAELTASFLGKSLDDLVEVKDFAVIFLSDRGSRKQVECRFQAVINKVDTPAQLASVKDIARLLTEGVIATGRSL